MFRYFSSWFFKLNSAFFLSEISWIKEQKNILSSCFIGIIAISIGNSFPDLFHAVNSMCLFKVEIFPVFKYFLIALLWKSICWFKKIVSDKFLPKTSSFFHPKIISAWLFQNIIFSSLSIFSERNEIFSCWCCCYLFFASIGSQYIGYFLNYQW